MSNLENNMSNNRITEEALEIERNKTSILFTEEIASGGLNMSMQLNTKGVLFVGESPFQEIKIIDSVFGRTLVTDGQTQSSQADEALYHESLVHPALLAIDEHQPKKVFIGGGGELATAREVLKHKSVERCVMVELDETVVKVSQKYLPEWNSGSILDPRLSLIIGDAYAYLMNTEETFDVIILDISDPTEAGPGIMLYVKEFYENVISRLNHGGVFVTQAGMVDSVGSVYLGDTCIGPIFNTLNLVFDFALTYTTTIPSFGSEWGFVMAFNTSSFSSNHNGDHRKIPRRIKCKYVCPEEINEKIDTRLFGGSKCLTFYDGEFHRGLFSLSKFMRKHLVEEKRIMTKDNPIFMY